MSGGISCGGREPIRVSKFFGYLGLPVTYATLWAVVAAALGRWDLALALFAVRMVDGDRGRLVRDAQPRRFAALVPDPAARSIRCGGLVCRPVWQLGHLAGPTPAPGSRGPDPKIEKCASFH